MKNFYTHQEWFDHLLPEGLPIPSSTLLSGNRRFRQTLDRQRDRCRLAAAGWQRGFYVAAVSRSQLYCRGLDRIGRSPGGHDGSD